MNVLLICGKDMQKSLENMCSRARNKRVIGTVTQVDDNLVELVKTTYRPHCIIWAQGIETDTSELDLILALQNEFPSTRIIVNHGKSDELTTALVENDIYDVVTRIVTDVEFIDLINTPLTSKEEYERFNKDTHKTKSATTKSRKKVVVNTKPIFICLAVIMLAAISVAALAKNKQANIQSSEDVTEASISIATEYVTDYLSLDYGYEFPTEKEKSTEKPTEKPTEKKEEATEAKKDKADKDDKKDTDDKDKDGSELDNGSNSNNNGSSTSSYQPIQQTPQQFVSQVEQPVQQAPQQSTPQVEQPVQQEPQQSTPQVQQPVQEPQPVVDDGLIYFDKDSYTVKVGETFDIYVTGLAASSGCKWTLTNSAVAEFVSSDTTKVTVRAKAKGSTVITGTAKSNGATRQVLVTVQ